MAYIPHDPATPVGTQTGPVALTSVRTNLNALRDAIIIGGGGFAGFNYSVSGGTADEPAIIYFKKSAEWIKAALTWGTTGGEDGNVTVAVYSYSSNSGGAYDTIGTETIAYDANGNITATTWS